MIGKFVFVYEVQNTQTRSSEMLAEKPKMITGKKIALWVFGALIVLSVVGALSPKAPTPLVNNQAQSAVELPQKTLFDSLSYFSGEVDKIKERYDINKESLKDHYASKDGLDKTCNDV
jgi:hypothetical protein